jgi:hypothetical protein
MRKQLTQLWQHRTGLLWLLVVLVTAVALVLSVTGRLDVASFILTVAVLLITSLALQAAWLTPARLVLERHQELRHTGDLMFWTYSQPDVPEGLLPAEASSRCIWRLPTSVAERRYSSASALRSTSMR